MFLSGDEDMPIIFLDVDGVLNNDSTISQSYYPFDEICLQNLAHLVEQTDANIVVTSSIRLCQENNLILLAELSKYRLDSRVIGYTPFMDGIQEKEILTYLSNMESEEPFVVLDDQKLTIPNLIKTDRKKGLTEKDVELAVSIIKKQNKNLQHKL